MDVWPDAIPWSVILLFLLNGRSVETTGLGEQPYPQNIKVEALNTNYKLKWDWDFTNYANVTFSVQKLIMDLYKEWQQMMECANITINECDISHITVVGSYKFQVSALLAGTYRTLSDVLPFNPLTDTVIGPPSNVTVISHDHILQISAKEPDGFKEPALKNEYSWVYNLILWKNSSDKQEKHFSKETGQFTISDVEASTTYCLKVRVLCFMSERKGLFSEVQCITTDPDTWHIWKGAIILFLLLGITSIVVYLCVCPFKRYMERILFPTVPFPLFNEKDFSQNKTSFILQEEEPVDLCRIISNNEDLSQRFSKASEESITDSGNYSNENEISGDVQCLSLR